MFSTQQAFCSKCGQAARPTWAPPSGQRLAPGLHTAEEVLGKAGLREWPEVEINAGLACLMGACPDADHLHWRCQTCGFHWISATKDAPR